MIANVSEIKPIYVQNQFTTQKSVQHRDNVSFEKKINNTDYKPINLKEGLNLIGKGAVKQVKDMFSAIVEHPLKTAAVIGGTTAALFALPLVGIPTAVGGAALAIGFAGFATGKTLYHGAKFIKNNEAGSYDIARENLKQIGGDSVDLALSAPFVPKALGEINKFAKYGKIGLNTEALTALKSADGLGAKFKVIKDANKNLYRSMNYNQAAEAELANLQGVTDAQKEAIKQYLKDYNVPQDKIPEVVLEKWAQERGIHTKPQLRYQSLKKTTMGYAEPTECRITLNDFGDDIVKINGNCNNDRYLQIGRARLNSDNKFEYIYKDKQTGQLFKETVDSRLVMERNNLINQYKHLSREAQRILTTTHEREHIDQFARFFMNGENMQLTPQSRQLYQQMASEIGPMTTQEAQVYRQMASYKPVHRTQASYVGDPSEIAARAKEIELIGRKDFQTLNRVFVNTNKAKLNTGAQEIALNAIRAQSVAT